MRSNFVPYLNTAIAANFNSPPFELKGGRYVLGGYGTFSAGTLKVQFTTDSDATWVDFGPQNAIATSLTVAGMTAFYAPPGRYRVALTGAGAPAMQAFFGEAQDSF